ELVKLDRKVVDRQSLRLEELNNLKRFEKKLPNAHQTSVAELENGLKVFRAEVPGRVPGSKAIYEKYISSEGKTIGYYKTTIKPNGGIVHIKDKTSQQVIK